MHPLAPGGRRDRVVVECRDPVLCAALENLRFRDEGDGRYVRRYPPGSLTDAIFARFETILMPLVLQTARLEPAPWKDALREVAARLDGAGVDWWLTGSAALAVRGVAVAPRDLDLVVADVDAVEVARALDDALIEPAVRVDDWFCRWWGRAWVGARVEWVGGVTEAADDPVPTDFGLTAAAALCAVSWDGRELRVPPLELQRAVAVRRGLAERVGLIDSYSG